MRDFILFGIQGSGKGTQSRLLAEKFDMEIFETGAELRSLAQSSSSLGQKVKEIIDSGSLVSDEVVMDIIANFLRRVPAGKHVIFDGIPRRVSQQLLFDNLMKELERDPLVIEIELGPAQALNRLTTRKVCEVCKTSYPVFYEGDSCSEKECRGKLIKRADDNTASIKTRLELYEKETLPVIENYKNDGTVLSVNGDQGIAEVNMEILKGLNKLLGKSP
ncbi:MAG: nucleoside monophosphate kinase [Candidatus Gracilibacteria bacterium]|nr:nucleoside monophosphate kinase [Candidatus Gracilibacteria bacterium]